MAIKVKDNMEILSINNDQLTKEEVISRLAYLNQKVCMSGDHLNAEKIKELAKKVYDEHFTIGFCGHFSAGKSSLINHLIAEGLLPTSPIPTSANIVKVQVGEPLARITFTDGKKIEFLPPYNVEEIKNYCLDGETVRLVEIQHPSDNFPPNVSIMDTPGIDSTDDAHRLATESILHLSDVIFYVMDYNHVQSELNLNFTKMINDRQIKLFLVINQIDKHREQEMSFEEFKHGVRDAFLRWNVQPQGIFFTSINNLNHPNNQLNELINVIHSLINGKNNDINKNAVLAAKIIVEDHLRWAMEELEHNNEQDIEIYNSLSQDEIEYIDVEYQQIQHKLNKINEAPILLENELNGELQKILFNSALMPYETRHLAQLFLESTQPNFKVGFIFSGKKTQEEKNRRLNELYQDLKAKISSQLDWHLKSMLQQLLDKFSLKDERLAQSVYDMDIQVGVEVLERAIKKDAQLNGDYVLNYAKEVSESIKQIYKRGILAKFDDIRTVMFNQIENNKNKLTEQLDHLNRIKISVHNINTAKQVIVDQRESLQRIIEGDVDQQLLKEASEQLVFGTDNEHLVTIRREMETQDQKKSLESEINVDKITTQEENYTEENPTIDITKRLKSAATKLRGASEVIVDLIGFKEDAKEMVNKANRLEENKFTIALFGAFSAGKSSFANALMGEHLLPTSPNPTTAAISKIMPPSDQYQHGTIRVKVKSNQELLDDLINSLKVFHLEADDFDTALKQIAKIDTNEMSVKAKPHYSFIKAIEKGLSHFSNQFNHVIESDITQLEPYVANEDCAAFIEWIEIYYDIPLTKQGITLVDTPGADSIHSRHTGVAFEFIKNADALIYVTYFNHAFSQADQEFLAQLGRVKEAFELDKMFFIVNAIDLAKSQEEIMLVTKHVENNLLTFGIRNPRIYPVSSKLALNAKNRLIDNLSIADNVELISSGFPRFEREFISFSLSELVNIATNSAMSDIKRVVQKLQGYISYSTEGEEGRKHRLLQVNELQQLIKGKIEQFDLYSSNRAIEQEIDELIYYVKQRLNIRQRDIFKLSFSPAVLRKDVKDIKLALRSALEEWLQFIQMDIFQELRATSLRVEKILKLLFENINSRLEEEIQKLDPSAVVSHLQLNDLKSPDLPNDRQLFDLNLFIPLLSGFKNHRHFFEQSGNQKMNEELEAQLQEPLTNFLNQISQEFKQSYIENLLISYQKLQKHLLVQIEQYYEGEIAALSMIIDIETLQIKHEKMLSLC